MRVHQSDVATAAARARGGWRRVGCTVVFAAVLAACGNDDPAPRGELISATDVATLPKAAIDQSTTASGLLPLAGAATCDVTIRRIGFHTRGPKGEDDVKETAALLVPGGAGCSGPFPLVAYGRGTNFIKARTLASATDGETGLLVGMLAAQGYVVVAPDYLGYGGSTFPYHPYLHADSEAATVIDAIRAARKALGDASVALNGRVMLTGYSQGGHVSMAAHRAAERDLPGEIGVVAAGHLSGPYDLSGTFVGIAATLPAGTPGSTAFGPLAVTGFQKVYGDVYANAAEYYKAPYAAGIENLLPGTLEPAQLIAAGQLPANLGDLITDKQVADLQNPASGLRRALEANSLLGWTPKAPVVLCGGARDPVVPFANTQSATAAFASRGANVTPVDVEQVPAFAALFPATLTAEQFAAYHGTTVPPLCLKVVRDQLFNALKG